MKHRVSVCRLHVTIAACLAICLAVAPRPLHAQGIEIWNTNCQKLLKQYKTAPRHKAFAVSYLSSGSGGGQSCGAAWGASSKQQAEAAALKQCKRYVAGSCGVNRSE